ncbi:MAG: hemerythrin domain-containing protein [Acidimicrobiales bacterium]
MNDAPALALAHVGVAMGARGASAASEAADVVIMVDRLDWLVEALAIARRTRRIALESVAVGTGLSLIAMVVAGAGGIPAVAGAVLQECIDAAVIVNALRARSAGARTDAARLPAEASQLGRRFREQHRDVVAVLDELEEVADVTETSDAPSAFAAARRVYQHLVVAVVPHELAEEQDLYPVPRQYLGGRDPLGTMSRGHAEIAHRVRRLGQLLDDLERGGTDAADVVELRSMLYGLQAIIALHTAQEVESLLSLVET